MNQATTALTLTAGHMGGVRIVHGVGYAHGVVPVPERGHDHGVAHGHVDDHGHDHALTFRVAPTW